MIHQVFTMFSWMIQAAFAAQKVDPHLVGLNGFGSSPPRLPLGPRVSSEGRGMGIQPGSTNGAKTPICLVVLTCFNMF